MSIRPDEMMRSKTLAITAVSTAVATRMYANASPQDPVLPCIVTTAKQEPLGHLTGQAGWTTADIGLAIFSTNYDEAVDLAEAIRIALNEFKGTVTVGLETVKVGILRLVSQIQDPQEPVDGSEQPIFKIIQSWTATMVEPIT